MRAILQVAQLTGFSDPVYAEAYVNVNQYDIVLDLLIVNQTSDTLQNVTLELATLGKTADLLTISLKEGQVSWKLSAAWTHSTLPLSGEVWLFIS